MGSIAKFHLAGVLCQVTWKAEFQTNAHLALVRNRACYVPAQSIFAEDGLILISKITFPFWFEDLQFDQNRLGLTY